MAEFTHEVVVDAPLEEVWAVLSAPERQAEWFPGMVSSTLEGDVRTIGTAAGGFMTERILLLDEEDHRLEYTITGPLQFEHHLGSLRAEAVEGGTRVTYGQQIRPEPLTYTLRAATRDALDGLRDLVERGLTSRGYQEPGGGGAP